MKAYTEPMMTVLCLENEDIITTSGITPTIADDCGYTPWGEIFNG